MSAVVRLFIPFALILVQAPIQVERIDPMGGYTQVVVAQDRGVKTVYVSGQAGVGVDFNAHVETAFARVARRLEQAGADLDDVVKIRVFVKDLTPDRYRVVADVRRRTFEQGSWPSSTVVGVQALARDALRVEIEAIAVVAEPGAGLRIERLAPSNGFSGAVAVTANRLTTIYVSGQVGEGDNLASQTDAAWRRIEQRLQLAGATLSDLVKITTYVADLDPARHLDVLRAAYPAALADGVGKPASTLIGVPALASERLAVEIDAIAVVGAGTAVERDFIEPSAYYSQAVAVRAGGPATIYLSGQVGTPGDPLADQADQVYGWISRRLRTAGAEPSDLLAIGVYMAEYAEQDLTALGPARARHGFAGDAAAASTLLGVSSLYAPTVRVEVEGVAMTRR